MKKTKLFTLPSSLFTLLLLLVTMVPVEAKKKVQQQLSDREYWCQQAWKMAQPVLENMAKGELQKNMKTEFSPSFDNRNRKVVYMETFGRLMAGIAPWLAMPDDGTTEGVQRKQLREWALSAKVQYRPSDVRRSQYIPPCGYDCRTTARTLSASSFAVLPSTSAPVQAAPSYRPVHTNIHGRSSEPPAFS